MKRRPAWKTENDAADLVGPCPVVLETNERRRALAEHAKTPLGLAAIKAVAARFGIAGGRPWRDFSLHAIYLLWTYTIGGLTIPPLEPEPWTPDESAEGRAFNEAIPF